MNNQEVRRCGFTLVELLVVIAIISLLVSILLPVLDKARVLAKRTVCSANHKQISVAVQLYVNDYDGRYMPAKSYLAATLNDCWAHFLMGYRGGAEYLPIKSATEGLGTSVLVCPTGLTYVNWSSYACNYSRLNIMWADGTMYPDKWCNAAAVDSPGETVLLYCTGNGYSFGSRRNLFGQWALRHADAHQGGYPVLWFDGHASFEGDDLMSEMPITHW